MHLGDIGPIIWVIVVLAGVISSAVKKAKQRAAAAPASAAPMPAPAPAQARFVAAPIPARIADLVAPPPAIVPAKPKPPRPQPGVPAPAREASAPAVFRGMFDAKGDLVRAIIASEVLGPPPSLREHLIWSPRRNEPSI